MLLSPKEQIICNNIKDSIISYYKSDDDVSYNTGFVVGAYELFEALGKHDFILEDTGEKTERDEYKKNENGYVPNFKEFCKINNLNIFQ